MTKRIVIIGGGTFQHIRPHFSLAAPAFGATVSDIANLVPWFFDVQDADSSIPGGEWEVHEYLTRMADGETLSHGPHLELGNKLETNEDVAQLLDRVVADSEVRIVFLPVALCDFSVEAIVTESPMAVSREEPGKRLPRLQTSKYDDSTKLSIALKPAEKIIRKVRKDRKDIFLVGFKTTTGFNETQQFEAGLHLLKSASCNLVLANDLENRRNMVITPEQAKYAVTTNRAEAIEMLVKMTASRATGTFTRSTVVEGQIVPWASSEIPESLKTVVNHCISRGAYKAFNGKTVGHFAAKIGEGKYLTSIRGTNFNGLLHNPERTGLVKVEAVGDDRVVAYGAKPSVGGQSQRIIFRDHPDADCIVHCHVQMKEHSPVKVQQQWPHECGSHQCGQNTSDGLLGFGAEGEHKIYAVMLDKHGPNIVFNKNTDPQRVIEFIETHFDLDHQTSELS